MFEGFENGNAAINGTRINYVKNGNGPPLLMLHGFPQTLAMWARVAPDLSDSFTVVCADLRGYGDSGKPEPDANCSNYSFRQMADDNVGLMQHLGFDAFHVVGHDRGGRTGHRMALDHPDRVLSLALLDIVPTYSMFMHVDRHVAKAYWHWYFLSQPYPFPEKTIAASPDLFFEACLVGWGATRLEDFPKASLDEYRRCWNQEDTIRGMCADYRAAALVDIELDQLDQDSQVRCPVLVYFGNDGTMTGCFDIPTEWAKRCETINIATSPGGHFFVDIYPKDVAKQLEKFIKPIAFAAHADKHSPHARVSKTRP